MPKPCHEAESARNTIPSRFRSTAVSASYASYYSCQRPCDSTSITLKVYELLATLRAQGLEKTRHFRRALSFLDTIAESERGLQRGLAALVRPRLAKASRRPRATNPQGALP